MGNISSMSQDSNIPQYVRLHSRQRVIAWNVNDDRRTEGFEGKAFPEYHSSKRVSGIVQKVKKELETSGTLMCLFEMTEQTCQKVVAEFSGFATKIVPYNLSKGTFQFLLISNTPDALLNVQAYPLTRSGVSYPDDKRPLAPKPKEALSEAFLEYKKEVLNDNFDKMVVGVHLSMNGKNVDVYFTHMGLSTEARMAQTSKLVEIIKSRLPNEFVVVGDLNAFDPSVKVPALFKPQIDKVLELPCTWLTEGMESTFDAFAFDIAFKLSDEERKKYFHLKDENKVEEFRTFCLDMARKYGTKGGPLDHAFASKGLNAKAMVYSAEGLSDHSMIEVVV